MQKRFLVKVIIYGILQWVILLAAMFVISLVLGVKEGAEMSAPPPWGFVMLAIIMAGIANVFVRRMKPANRQEALVSGGVWSGITIAFMVITTVANGTQSIIFGNWGAYALLISQAVGTLFGTTSTANQPPVVPPSTPLV